MCAAGAALCTPAALNPACALPGLHSPLPPPPARLYDQIDPSLDFSSIYRQFYKA